MIERVIIAGAGGQGVILLGKVLAEAEMREERFVTCLPSYGAEVRGGTAHCMVVVSDKEIGSPYIEEADSLIVMNEPSLKRFRPRLKKEGLAIINSSLVPAYKDSALRVFQYPFTDIALELGDVKAANMVALGCFISKSGMLRPETVSEVIFSIAPKDKKGLVEVNRKALKTGRELE